MDTLSYTKASQRLFISQPMLSRHIKSIEEEIGVELFSRNTRGVQPTPAGLCLANGLKNINTEYSFLIDQTRAYKEGERGTIQIGVLISGALGNVADMFSSYELSHPDVHIAFSAIESPEAMYQAIISSKIDCGLGIGVPMFKQKLSFIDICENNRCIVMSKNSPLAEKSGPLSIHELRDYQFITPADSISTAYKELIARCSAAGFTPNVLIVPDIMSVALTVELNRGITFFHEHSVFYGSPNLVFRRLSNIDSNGTFSLYWNPANADQKLASFIKYTKNSSKSIKSFTNGF